MTFKKDLKGVLFCDLTTDAEKRDFFASGRGYETGINTVIKFRKKS